MTFLKLVAHTDVSMSLPHVSGVWRLSTPEVEVRCVEYVHIWSCYLCEVWLHLGRQVYGVLSIPEVAVRCIEYEYTRDYRWMQYEYTWGDRCMEYEYNRGGRCMEYECTWGGMCMEYEYTWGDRCMEYEDTWGDRYMEYEYTWGDRLWSLSTPGATYGWSMSTPGATGVFSHSELKCARAHVGHVYFRRNFRLGPRSHLNELSNLPSQQLGSPGFHDRCHFERNDLIC